MRLAPKVALIALLIMGIGGLPHTSFAITIYQQLTNSDGGQNGVTIVGQFISNSSGKIDGGKSLAVIRNLTNGTITNITLNLRIGTTSNSLSYSYAGSDLCNSATLAPGESLFCEGTIVGLNGETNWIEGQQYYVYQQANLGGAEIVQAQSYASADRNFYGYLTDADANSLPIAPGVPGFTDVGIATSSQQIYCSKSFSTSTGFLDSAGASLSTGLCNVTVFLFVPSANALSNFQSLASTTRAKIPFSYYYDVRGILLGQSASSSQNLPTYSINLGSVDFGSTSGLAILPTRFEFFSTTTINKYLPTGMHDLLYNLMIYAIWIEVMFLLYHRIVPHKVKI